MNPTTIIKELWTLVKSDLAKDVLPLLLTFLTSIAGNPTQINFVAQLAKFEADFLAAVPGIGQDVLKDLVSLVSQEAQALLTPPAAAKPTA